MFRIEVDSKSLRNALSKLAALAEDVREAWPSVFEVLRTIVGRQFTSQGAAGTSGAWRQLRSPYAEWKESRFPGQPILRASDRLFKSLTEEGGEHIEKAGPLEAAFGTAVPYAGFHQQGTELMTDRRIFDLTPQDEEQLAEAMQARLAAECRAMGFEVRR